MTSRRAWCPGPVLIDREQGCSGCPGAEASDHGPPAPWCGLAPLSLPTPSRRLRRRLLPSLLGGFLQSLSPVSPSRFPPRARRPPRIRGATARHLPGARPRPRPGRPGILPRRRRRPGPRPPRRCPGDRRQHRRRPPLGRSRTRPRIPRPEPHPWPWHGGCKRP